MCEELAFHHGPRPLQAQHHAFCFVNPRWISCRARVRTRASRPYQAAQFAPCPAVEVLKDILVMAFL